MTDREPLVRVDTRWDGTHGIGRYAREVVSRLTTPWQPLAATGSPSSPREAARRDPGLRPADLVYSPGYNVSLASRARQLVTVHDLIHLDVGGAKGRMYRAYYDAVLKPVIKRTGTVLTVSETSAGAIRDWLADERVEVVNAGIGVSAAFVVDGPKAAATRPYFMYVGNMRRHKNVDVVFDSVRGLDADVRMLLPRSDAATALERARHLGVDHQVRVMHDLEDDELASLYRGAVATFMPSRLEGFGLPALESTSVGTPVLYWAGCASIAEIVGERGLGVATPEVSVPWRQAARNALLASERIQPPPRSQYDWSATSRRVSTVVGSLHQEGRG